MQGEGKTALIRRRTAQHRREGRGGTGGGTQTHAARRKRMVLPYYHLGMQFNIASGCNSTPPRDAIQHRLGMHLPCLRRALGMSKKLAQQTLALLESPAGPAAAPAAAPAAVLGGPAAQQASRRRPAADGKKRKASHVVQKQLAVEKQLLAKLGMGCGQGLCGRLVFSTSAGAYWRGSLCGKGSGGEITAEARLYRPECGSVYGPGLGDAFCRQGWPRQQGRQQHGRAYSSIGSPASPQVLKKMLSRGKPDAKRSRQQQQEAEEAEYQEFSVFGAQRKRTAPVGERSSQGQRQARKAQAKPARR
jgi:hypothetical protein